MKQQTEYKLLSRYEFWRRFNIVSPMEVKFLSQQIEPFLGIITDEDFTMFMESSYQIAAIQNFFKQHQN